MADNVKDYARIKNAEATVTLVELSEAELSEATGGSTGAGKVAFNPFVITKHVDKSSPILFF